MDKRVRDLISSLSMIGNYDFGGYYGSDKMVDECLMNMYFYMMYSGINLEKQEEYFHDFEKSYNKLNKEQQEIVEKEYFDIIEAQKKNREKIKKKGMINYE